METKSLVIDGWNGVQIEVVVKITAIEGAQGKGNEEEYAKSLAEQLLGLADTIDEDDSPVASLLRGIGWEIQERG